MLEQFVNKIIEIAGPEKLKDQHGVEWVRNDYEIISAPTVTALDTSTLSGIVDYIKSNFDNPKDEALMVHVESYYEVSVLSAIKTADRIRDYFLTAKYTQPRYLQSYRFGQYYSLDQFRIWLMSGFEENADQEAILRFIGSVKDGQVSDVTDDGISQSVQAKAGITVENVMLPSELNLAPFRTFPEIAQPESKFKFRMQSGASEHQLPTAGLFEADGGKWEADAVNAICNYFIDADLPDNITIMA